MNAAHQLSFLPPAQDEIQNALRIFQNSGVPHMHYNRFVRALAVAFKSAGAGSTIVAACPGAPTLDEVIFGFRKEVRRFEARNHQAPSEFEPIELSAPCRPTRTMMEVELLDRYTHALQTIQLGQRGRARFWDDDLSAMHQARTPIGRLVALLRAKAPPLVILRDSQNLKCPNNTNDETRAAWRLIVDIARQSGVPHIMFGPVSTVCTMVKDPELMGEVQLEVLRPYDCAEPSELACFTGTLHDYNSAIPWLEKESLVDRAKEIDAAVSGDVDRLRRWIVRAVSCALGEEDTMRVSWRHFQQTQPLPAQQKLAREDRDHALDLLDPIVDAPPSSGAAPKHVSKRKRKPGQRNPHRDQIMKV